MKRFLHWIAVAVMVGVVLIGQQLGLFAGDAPTNGATGGAAHESRPAAHAESAAEARIDEHGQYTAKDEVALYLNTYGKLPSNFITKEDAEKLGYDNHSRTLDEVAPGMSIGGSHFGNYEHQLPEAKGRHYKECDIDYKKGVRGVKRIVYSSDGLIYYTGDHYKTFERLY